MNISSSPQTRWQDPFTVRLDVKDPHVRLHCVIIGVRDQERSLKFYIGQLGFTLVVDAMIGPEVRWIEIALPDGSALLAIVKADDRTTGPAGHSRHVVFVTDDVEAKYKEWSPRGVHFSKLPGRPGWSPDAGTFASFEDPDGNTFALVNFDEITRDIEERRRTLAERLEAERRKVRELEVAKEVLQEILFPRTLPQMCTLDYRRIVYPGAPGWWRLLRFPEPRTRTARNGCCRHFGEGNRCSPADAKSASQPAQPAGSIRPAAAVVALGESAVSREHD